MADMREFQRTAFQAIRKGFGFSRSPASKCLEYKGGNFDIVLYILMEVGIILFKGTRAGQDDILAWSQQQCAEMKLSADPSVVAESLWLRLCAEEIRKYPHGIK